MFKILFISLLPLINANSRCSITTRVPNYHLIEPCHRSTLGIAARAKYVSLTSCKRLGIEKKALALNFSPTWNRSEPEYPCEVLKCAEAEGGLSLSNDTRYDYYSIYAKPIPNVNATCVPGIGMFYLLSHKLNYTNAEDKCKNISSIFANVNSEQRTDALAQLLTGAGVATAFVGLKKKNETGFIEINVSTAHGPQDIPEEIVIIIAYFSQSSILGGQFPAETNSKPYVNWSLMAPTKKAPYLKITPDL